MRNYRTIFIVVLLAGLFSFSFSQTPRGYEILEEGLFVSDLSLYHNALDQANLDQYRQLDARTRLFFEDGVIVEILSVREISVLGLPINLKTIAKGTPNAEINSLFEVHPSGIIVEKAKVPNWIAAKTGG